MPPRKKKGEKSTTGRGAAVEDAPEEPVAVVEVAPAPSELEAETTGHLPPSQMDTAGEVNLPLALFHCCMSLLSRFYFVQHFR